MDHKNIAGINLDWIFYSTLDKIDCDINFDLI